MYFAIFPLRMAACMFQSHCEARCRNNSSRLRSGRSRLCRRQILFAVLLRSVGWPASRSNDCFRSIRIASLPPCIGCDVGLILYRIWQTSLVILLRRKFYSRLLYYHVCKHVTFNNSVHYKFSHFLVVSVPQAAWDRNYKFRPLTRFFDGGPPSHLPRCTDIIHVMNSPSPSPFLHTASDQKTAQWEGLRTRLV